MNPGKLKLRVFSNDVSPKAILKSLKKKKKKLLSQRTSGHKRI